MNKKMTALAVPAAAMLGIALVAVDTPHDFLVFGGDSGDRFFDPGSSDFHGPTVTAAADGIADWCEARITLGRVETADHQH